MTWPVVAGHPTEVPATTEQHGLISSTGSRRPAVGLLSTPAKRRHEHAPE
jgi:hypothetical protein